MVQFLTPTAERSGKRTVPAGTEVKFNGNVEEVRT